MGEDFIREIIFQTLMPVLVSVFSSYISLLIDQLVTSDRYVHLLFCWSEVRYFRAFCVRFVSACVCHVTKITILFSVGGDNSRIVTVNL